MKTSQIALMLLLLTFCMNASASSIRHQLKRVNFYWADHPLADKILDEKKVFASDRELIQLHLQMVEKTLRANNLQSLNREQKKHRLALLDVLHDYWVRGLFPQNTGHAVRTPYFIDVNNTACAVGQLVISSGYIGVAKQISRENNNGYISELVLKYPRIVDWAKEHGFTIEELAWIQPCYPPPPDTLGLRHPTCHNAENGYFCPDFSQLQGPLTKSFYRWENTNWVPWMDAMCGNWMFNYCKAGKYKWEVKDNLNTIHTFSAELVAPPPATVTITKSGNFNTCNGAITVSAQGGVQPFRYFWSGHTATTSVIGSVCDELITMVFYEKTYWCPQYFQIQPGPVGLQEKTMNIFHISPNPVADMLQLNFDAALIPKYKLTKIMNSQGQMVLQTDLGNEQTKINLSQFPPGLYFLQVDDYRVQRFVKE